ncbi:hypothetical protein [Aquimarina sp. I32.4]|uniref:hypothetical protein n=1 Tax=Aquimarina sp. I32.4 TaxID=2053903 RepID=UPI001304C3D7|nr:hypothetical protein [Aquimarina sp. I32.4]
MKNLIILLGILFLFITISSCEKNELKNETYETEIQLIEPGEDGAIDPGDRREN